MIPLVRDFSFSLVHGIIDALYLKELFPREHPIRVHFNIIEEQFDNLNEPQSKLQVPILISSIVYLFF